MLIPLRYRSNLLLLNLSPEKNATSYQSKSNDKTNIFQFEKNKGLNILKSEIAKPMKRKRNCLCLGNNN